MKRIKMKTLKNQSKNQYKKKISKIAKLIARVNRI
jgi:hypothetical protein